MSQKNMIDGETIELGGAQYVLPPLPLIKMPKIKALMEGVSEVSEEYVKLFVDAIQWSLARNYPDLPEDFAARLIDMQNWETCFTAFMRVNRLEATTGQDSEGKASPSIGTS